MTLLERSKEITDADLLAVLRKWRWHQNKVRSNVMREGQKWVHSDTLGVVCSRDGRLVLSKVTKEYPASFKLLCKWMQDASPSLIEHFPFTCGSQSRRWGVSTHPRTPRSKGSHGHMNVFPPRVAS